jgi:hypothetical protein
MKASLLSLILALALAAPALAGLHLTAEFAPRDESADSAATPVTALILKVRDDDEKVVWKAINAAQSSATDVSKWSLHWQSGTKSATVSLSNLRRMPSSGNQVSQLGATVSTELGDADLAKDTWKLVIAGDASAPAITLDATDGQHVVIPSVSISVPALPKEESDYIEKFTPISPNLTLGGGEDGSLFGIDFAYKSPVHLTADDQLYGVHGEFTGSFTPKPDEALRLYSRFSGDFGGFRTVRIPSNSWVTGSLYLDINTHFESDQQADNYNWTVGTGVWGFIGLKPLTLFSKGLYSVLNLGQHTMEDSPILTVFAGYDYIASSELDASANPQGDQRVRFLARYRTPLWRDVDLPILPTIFDVDGVADFSGIWDFDHSRVMPEIKASIEFMPRSVKDNMLAFTLSYVSGKISPTFVDEDAFLAGLRWKF